MSSLLAYCRQNRISLPQLVCVQYDLERTILPDKAWAVRHESRRRHQNRHLVGWAVRPKAASKRNHTMKVDSPFSESAKDKDMKHSREPS